MARLAVVKRDFTWSCIFFLKTWKKMSQNFKIFIRTLSPSEVTFEEQEGAYKSASFFGPFEKNSRIKKLKTQENYSKLKQKTQGFGKYSIFVF